MRKLSLAILACMLMFSRGEAMEKLNIIQLPEAATSGKVSLEEAIAKRRSVRNFTPKDLSWEQISQLLWSAQGITAKKGNSGLRAAPSAGALYPIEVYLLTKGGLYRYIPDTHQLEQLSKSDLRGVLRMAAFGQVSIAQAPVNIVICALYSRITPKYGERGIMYTHIEVGHIAENVHLEAVALGLGSVPIGAFDVGEVKKAISLPEDQEPLYIIPVGYTK